MKTLVLPPRYSHDSAILAKAASRAGHAVERLPSWHVPTALADENVYVYGEPLFVMHAAAELALALIETPYDWLANLPAEYLLRDVRNATMAEARTITSRRFIKPAMEKFFRAAVYTSGADLPGKDIVSDSVPVILAEPVAWDAEFRCFVLDRKVVASSPYLINGVLARAEDDSWIAPDDVHAEMESFAQRLISDARVPLPPAIVLDVGRIVGRGWAAIETNPAWGSGLYGCDPDEVVKVVARSCLLADRISQADRAWTIDHGSEDFK